MEKNNCKELFNEYYKSIKMYNILLKNECITHSCKRRKEELYGNINKIYEELFNCIIKKNNYKNLKYYKNIYNNN